MNKLKEFVQRRIKHIDTRIAYVREKHGDHPEKTHNYYGGHGLGYWEGKKSAFEDILDWIDENSPEETTQTPRS